MRFATERMFTNHSNATDADDRHTQEGKEIE
jgi:hypothetical protein